MATKRQVRAFLRKVKRLHETPFDGKARGRLFLRFSEIAPYFGNDHRINQPTIDLIEREAPSVGLCAASEESGIGFVDKAKVVEWRRPPRALIETHLGPP